MGISADGKILTADLTEIKGDLWSIAANGSETDARRIKSGETNGRRRLAALHDGSFVYSARIGDKYDIWTTSPDGQNTPPLTNDAYDERTLTASSDGHFIVFSPTATAVCIFFGSIRKAATSNNYPSAQLTIGSPTFSPTALGLFMFRLKPTRSSSKESPLKAERLLR